MEESADTKKVGKKIDLLTFSKNTIPPVMPKEEIDKLAKEWIELVLDQLQHKVNCPLSSQKEVVTIK